MSGPVSLSAVNPLITCIRVQTASEMLQVCLKHYKSCNAAILSAAVADFTPVETLKAKMKRGKSEWNLTLKPTADIASELGKRKSGNQVLAGFALETENEISNAKEKLKRKNFDFIVLNSLRDVGAGFGTDTNKITILDKNNNIDKFELKSKSEVARDIVDKMIEIWKAI